jgi:Icc-related predicted phosphoesterase
VSIDGQRFIGSTLWFAHSGVFENGDDSLNDFSKISGFREWVGKQASRSANYLNTNLMEGDVVITHHLPSSQSVHKAYQGSPLNKYFLHDVSGLVEGAGAKLWIHGHTHSSMDYWANRTRVVCNPFGYLRYEENSQFVEKLTISV